MSDNGHSLADLDESALVERAKTDQKAFGELYERYVKRIYNYIYYRTGNHHDAEDLTARVFQRALQHIGNYVDRGVPFSAWLYRIAHNLVVDHVRRQHPVATSAIDVLSQQAAEHEPEQAVEISEAHADLINAMHILSEVEQEVIILRFVEGLSHREVAEIIGKTEGSSRVIQYQALAKLQEHLSKRL